MIQSYPSNMQMSVTDPIDKNWFLDFHHAESVEWRRLGNSRLGNPTVFQTPATLVPGTIDRVEVRRSDADSVNFKTQPVVAYAGAICCRTFPRQRPAMSSPTQRRGSIVWFIRRANAGLDRRWVKCICRCRRLAEATRATIGYCNSDTVQWVLPCANTLAANAAQIIQSRDDVPDPNALNWRRLGMGFMGPGRQYRVLDGCPGSNGDLGRVCLRLVRWRPERVVHGEDSPSCQVARTQTQPQK